MSMSLRPAALPALAAALCAACLSPHCHPYAALRGVESPGCVAAEQKGGYCCGAPPLPIPNREVKPARADGTAKAGE